MNRRTFLIRSGGAVGSATALAGCTEHTLTEAERKPVPFEDVSPENVDLPVEQRLEIAAEGVERAEGTEVGSPEELESYLVERGIAVEKLEGEEKEGSPILSLEYVDEPADEGTMRRLGVVAGGYAALVEAGHGSELLEASLLDSDAEKFGVYEVRHSWATEYGEGKLTAREYAGEIVVSLKTE